jgi:hypothetical protein
LNAINYALGWGWQDTATLLSCALLLLLAFAISRRARERPKRCQGCGPKPVSGSRRVIVSTDVLRLGRRSGPTASGERGLEAKGAEDDRPSGQGHR